MVWSETVLSDFDALPEHVGVASSQLYEYSWRHDVWLGVWAKLSAQVQHARKQSGGVGGGKQDAVWFEQRHGRSDEFTEILLCLKHAVLLRLRKGRWIERDQVELPSLLCQTPQPIENIARDEGVVRHAQAGDSASGFRRLLGLPFAKLMMFSNAVRKYSS